MASRLPDLSHITPGEILTEDWIKPNGLSGAEVCRRTGLPPSRLTEILKGRRAITADTALRLGRFFGTGATFWLNLQQAYDVEQASKVLGKRLDREVRPLVVG